MKNTFIWRNRVVIVSGALLIISAHMLSRGPRLDPFAARPSAWVLDLIQLPELAATQIGEDTAGVVKDYLDLVGVRRENSRLREKLHQVEAERARLAELELENQHLAQLLELRDTLQMDAIAADVIGGDATGQAQTIVISRGESSRLKAGMAVFNNEGIIGKLVSVGRDASRVLLIDDHNSAVDGFDQRTRARGIVAGQIEGDLTMKYVERSEDIVEGDAIVTSGLDGTFPRGLLIGRVTTIQRDGPGLFFNVQAKSAVDFFRLERVMVLRQLPPKIPDQGKS
jgi:rod shape-determining protein MreC